MRSTHGLAITLGVALLTADVAQAAPTALITRIRQVTQKKRIPLPTSIYLKQPCHQRNNYLAVKKMLFAQSAAYCKRHLRFKTRYPAFAFTSRKPVRFLHCRTRLRITAGGYCSKTIYYARGYFQGVAYGKRRRRRPGRLRVRPRRPRTERSGVDMSQDSYCRTPTIMAKLKQSALNRAKKHSLRYCLRRRFTLVMKMKMHEYDKLKNISRKKNTYICGARFRVTFQCERELLH